jgi:hypothetical protein
MIMSIPLDAHDGRKSVFADALGMMPESILFFFGDPAFDEDVFGVLWVLMLVEKSRVKSGWR